MCCSQCWRSHSQSFWRATHQTEQGSLVAWYSDEKGSVFSRLHAVLVVWRCWQKRPAYQSQMGLVRVLVWILWPSSTRKERLLSVTLPGLRELVWCLLHVFGNVRAETQSLLIQKSSIIAREKLILWPFSHGKQPSVFYSLCKNLDQRLISTHVILTQGLVLPFRRS
jgi:hypothetical protein